MYTSEGVAAFVVSASISKHEAEQRRGLLSREAHAAGAAAALWRQCLRTSCVVGGCLGAVGAVVGLASSSPVVGWMGAAAAVIAVLVVFLDK